MAFFELLMPKCFPQFKRVQLLQLVKVLADVPLVVHLYGGKGGEEVLHSHQGVLQPISQNLNL